MTKDKALESLIATLEPDIRLEAVLSVLLENNTIDLENLVIRTKGTFKRPYSKDMLGVEMIGKKSGHREMLYIDISREGLYDMLPEGLFHQTQTKSFKTTQDSVDEFREHRREEKEARNFFLPLEQEFYRLRILLEMEERKALFAFTDPSHQGLFAKFWRKQPALNEQQSAIFFFLLPLFYRIVGNLPLTALCFEAILGHPVTLNWINSPVQSSKDMLMPLGHLKLGVNLILGDIWSDEFPAIEVMIGPLEEEVLPDYLPGGKVEPVLELLYSFFLPVEIDPVTKVLAKEPGQPLMFVETMGSGRLGFTTAI